MSFRCCPLTFHMCQFHAILVYPHLIYRSLNFVLLVVFVKEVLRPRSEQLDPGYFYIVLDLEVQLLS